MCSVMAKYKLLTMYGPIFESWLLKGRMLTLQYKLEFMLGFMTTAEIRTSTFGLSNSDIVKEEVSCIALH